jgi:hypothetical protein
VGLVWCGCGHLLYMCMDLGVLHFGRFKIISNWDQWNMSNINELAMSSTED